MRDYLGHLANPPADVSASTQNQACSAILFLCREVLGVERRKPVAGRQSETR